jgi:hypothetical protein
MFWTRLVASIWLMSGFIVPGACVVPMTSSSLAAARAGKAAKEESVKPMRARRPNIGAKLTLALRKLKHDACLS